MVFGGILLWLEVYCDWVCSGIILYGVLLMDEFYVSYFELKLVMVLKFSLIVVCEYKVGEFVGYGGIWVSECDICLGVVVIGYGDGYLCSVFLGILMWLNGCEVGIVGWVLMDMIFVDFGLNVIDKVGDEVLLWGVELLVEKIVVCIGISVYELIIKLIFCVVMEYLGE